MKKKKKDSFQKMERETGTDLVTAGCMNSQIKR